MQMDSIGLQVIMHLKMENKDMIVYFNNDDGYKQDAINKPVLADGKPIGFISEVSKERVTCYLWDMFIKKDEFLCSYNPLHTEVRSISIEVPK